MMSVFNEPTQPITEVKNSLLSALAVLRAGKVVSDAIEKAGRRAINNEADESSDTSEPHPLSAVYGEVSDAIQKVCDFIDSNPDVEPHRVQDINRQLLSIVRGVGVIGEASHRLDYSKRILDRELRARSSTDTQATPCWGSNQVDDASTFNTFQKIYAKQAEVV